MQRNFCTLFKGKLRNKVITMFDCETVQESHSIKPVIKGSLSEWEPTRAISHKGALQPLRKRACMEESVLMIIIMIVFICFEEKSKKTNILEYFICKP